MKRLLFTALFTVLPVAAPALAADVGVSVNVGQPGFYGRIDIGRFPQPQVIYQEPIIVQPAPVAVVRRPIYLRVPPGHAKHWSKHCHEYYACGQPVYFVDEGWYRDVYAPRYHDDGDRDERHGKSHGKGHGKEKGRKDG